MSFNLPSKRKFSIDTVLSFNSHYLHASFAQFRTFNELSFSFFIYFSVISVTMSHVFLFFSFQIYRTVVCTLELASFSFLFLFSISFCFFLFFLLLHSFKMRFQMPIVSNYVANKNNNNKLKPSEKTN